MGREVRRSWEMLGQRKEYDQIYFVGKNLVLWIQMWCVCGLKMWCVLGNIPWVAEDHLCTLNYWIDILFLSVKYSLILNFSSCDLVRRMGTLKSTTIMVWNLFHHLWPFVFYKIVNSISSEYVFPSYLLHKLFFLLIQNDSLHLLVLNLNLWLYT